MIGNEITLTIVESMILDGYIPKSEPFEVTSNLLDIYFSKFKEMYPSLANAKCQKKPSQVRYFRKLTGLTLLKLSQSRIPIENVKSSKTVRLKSGILYLISNPAFPGMFKVGITQDLNTRLSQYQTYDPYRRFKVEHYKFVDDMRQTEKEILLKHKVNISVGEWFDSQKVKEVVERLKLDGHTKYL